MDKNIKSGEGMFDKFKRLVGIEDKGIDRDIKTQKTETDEKQAQRAKASTKSESSVVSPQKDLASRSLKSEQLQQRRQRSIILSELPEVPNNLHELAKVTKRNPSQIRVQYQYKHPADIRARLHELIKFKSAGGILVCQKIAENFEAKANMTEDPELKLFYKKLAGSYGNLARELEFTPEVLNEILMERTGAEPLKGNPPNEEAKEFALALANQRIRYIDEMVWEKTGCALHPIEYFSEEFNSELFDALTNFETEGGNDYDRCIRDGEDMIVCEVAYADLNRKEVILVNEDKSTIQFEPSPEEGSRQDQINWKRNKIKGLLKFCGFDENAQYESQEARDKARVAAEAKLYMLSKCISQHMGNIYTRVANTSISPQYVGKNLFIIPSSGAEENEYIEVIKNKDGEIEVRYHRDIKDMGLILVPELKQRLLPTNKATSSANISVGIILDSQNQWKESGAGKMGYSISKA